MAASPSNAKIQSVIRRSLKKLAKKHGGQYQLGYAWGTDTAGNRWHATYSILRASNGEVALMPVLIKPDLDKTWREWNAFDHIKV